MKLPMLMSIVLLCAGSTGGALAQDFCRDSGTSVEKLIDGVDVYGPVRGSEPIGETEDLIMGTDGEVLALVAEIGGFLDIGDVNVSVPWELVEFGEGWARIPVVEEDLGEYEVSAEEIESGVLAGGIVARADDIEPGTGAWRATSLLGDAVETSDSFGFGVVHDLLVSGDEVEAIIIRPNLGLGVFAEYAIPFQPLVEGEWKPGDPVFELIYDQTEMEDIGAFACD